VSRGRVEKNQNLTLIEKEKERLPKMGGKDRFFGAGKVSGGKKIGLRTECLLQKECDFGVRLVLRDRAAV